MSFEDAVANAAVILTEGAVIERLRRDPAVELDPYIANAGLIYDQAGKQAMTRIYRQYIDIASRYRLPMIVSAPTWRASSERINKSAYSGRETMVKDCADFINRIRQDVSQSADCIYIAGLIACRGDSYEPREALTADKAEAYHRLQAQELAHAGVDFILAATLPAVSEALGIAAALSQCAIPYSLSFVIRSDGRVLDGTPLQAAIEKIDAAVNPGPLFYQINCVHPAIFRKAIEQSEPGFDRLLGLQANTSEKSPEELDGLGYLDTSEPEEFAESMLALHTHFGLKIIGGCCGTDHRHIEEIAKRLSGITTSSNER
ncbi:MAG: homocysteine S-methyltransferase family protein [Deltaproteobacteria bacterium]|jgi:S-methylmethionine-dependent homocysteine/selenocysteine methylase|nr:homocysteine S-methyltransferase family protein [Deltaproteobacteria bacterium]